MSGVLAELKKTIKVRFTRALETEKDKKVPSAVLYYLEGELYEAVGCAEQQIQDLSPMLKELKDNLLLDCVDGGYYLNQIEKMEKVLGVVSQKPEENHTP